MQGEEEGSPAWRAGRRGQRAQSFRPFSPPRSNSKRPRGPPHSPEWGGSPAASPGTRARCTRARCTRAGRSRSQRLPELPVPVLRPLRPALAPRTLGKENPHEGRPVPSSRPQPGEVSQPSGVARAPTCEQEAPGALGEAAGAGPALHRRDLGAGNGGERLRLQVCAAPASPGHEFDFRVWPQVGHGGTQSPGKVSKRLKETLSPRGASLLNLFLLIYGLRLPLALHLQSLILV